jgi:tRNA-dihydrouridine synthase 3
VRDEIPSSQDAGDGPGRVPGLSTKEQKKAQRGANKGKEIPSFKSISANQDLSYQQGRRFGKIRDELDLCYKIASGSVCDFGPE